MPAWLFVVLVAVGLVTSACAQPSTPAPTAVPPATTASPAAAPPGPSPAAVASPPGSPAPLAKVAVPSPSPSPSPVAAASPTGGKLSVVATTTQIQDFVRNVGGDWVSVHGVLPPDADAHGYQPTTEDARKLAQADLILYNGVGMEPWLDDLARNARPRAPVVNLARAANLTIREAEHEHEEEEHGEGEEHDEAKDEASKEEHHEHAGGDPHVWLDPTNAQKMVAAIRDTLIRVDAAGTSVYQANAAAYTRDLDDLDAQIKQEIATIPAEQRKLVTSHEAFGYYADRYGLEIVGTVIPSTSSDAQASAAQVQELIEDIRQANVKAIFTERSSNPRLVEQVAQQAGVKVVSSLYSDSLGPPGSEGDTYVKMMRFNTREIVQGLR